MKIYIGADHRGFALKEKLKEYFAQKQYRVIDVGNAAYDPDDDYPDVANAVAEKVGADPDARGILICGSGAGVAIAANRHPFVRAATITDIKQAFMARNDENVNILALAADFIDEKTAEEIADVFLTTPFSGDERHARRLSKIKN